MKSLHVPWHRHLCFRRLWWCAKGNVLTAQRPAQSSVRGTRPWNLKRPLRRTTNCHVGRSVPNRTGQEACHPAGTLHNSQLYHQPTSSGQNRVWLETDGWTLMGGGCSFNSDRLFICLLIWWHTGIQLSYWIFCEYGTFSWTFNLIANSKCFMMEKKFLSLWKTQLGSDKIILYKSHSGTFTTLQQQSGQQHFVFSHVTV